METSPAFFQPTHSHHPQAGIPQGVYPTQNGSVTSPAQTAQQLAHHHQGGQQPGQTSPLMSPPNPYAQGAPPPQQMYGAPGGPYAMQYPINASQANAMAAATVAGPHYAPIYGNMPVGQDKTRGSPSAIPQQMGRRISHVASPVGVPPQGGMNGPTRGPGGSMAPPAQLPPSQDAGETQDTPLYVNAKQFHRILKRRSARQKLEEQLRLTSKARKPYLHESRHNHAMRRPRGPGGRFLTSEEVAALEEKEKLGGSEEPVIETPAKAETGSKRKAGGGAGNSSKKAKASRLAVKEVEEGVDGDADADD
jgi:nuclear transcription factor Y alpha